jgi:segregation and condensation protein B
MKYSFTSKILIEAALFVGGRPIKIDKLKIILPKDDANNLSDIIEDLNHSYKSRKSYIEIEKKDQEYWMRVDPEIAKKLPKFTKSKISKELMQILSYIALYQPIKSPEIRKNLRIKGINEKLDVLKNKGFINLEKDKRSWIVSTTNHFANTFNLDPDRIYDDMQELIAEGFIQLHELQDKSEVDEDNEKTNGGKKKKYTEEEKKLIEKRYYELINKKREQHKNVEPNIDEKEEEIDE